jgi:cytochrome-b5 reductase
VVGRLKCRLCVGIVDKLQKAHVCVSVQVYHVLNQAPPGWTGGVGFITADIIKQHIDPPAEDVLVLRCGPGPMNVAVKKALDGLGYTREMQFEF